MTPAAPAARVPAPPAALTCNLHRLDKDMVIHRIHASRFTATEFNPGLGNSRFAPFMIGGAYVPTAYGATSLDCAIFETIFHEIDPAAAFKTVYWSELETLSYSTVALTRDVDVAKLFSADLLKWGLERSQLIDTPKSTYSHTQAWSPAIHGDAQAPHGMIWTSKRYDEDKALMLFGDRVLAGDLKILTTVEVTSCPDTLKAISDQARRADILIAR